MQGFDFPTARLLPGVGSDGWLARLPGVVVWVPHTGEQAVVDLLEICATSSGPAEVLGRVATRLGDPEAESWPAFALVAARRNDVVVLVHGPAKAVVHQDGEELEVTGAVTGSWANRVVTNVARIELGSAGKIDPSGPADMRFGVVPASGALLLPSSPDRVGAVLDMAAIPERGGQVLPDDFFGEEESTATSVEATEASEEASQAQPEASEAEATETEPAAAEAEESEPKVAEEVPNETEEAVVQAKEGGAEEQGEAASEPPQAPPEAESSAKKRGRGSRKEEAAGLVGTSAEDVATVAGALFDFESESTLSESPTQIVSAPASEADQTIVEGSVPQSALSRPIGTLVWETGETDTLLRNTIIGRDATHDSRARSGEVDVLIPEGHTESMSRVHAEIRTEGRDVVLVDRGSTNGTFIWDEGVKTWHRLEAGAPTTLLSGAIVAFGERTATFDASGPV